ncbi:uncharacterized protein LOC110724253 [Chenopodium quinoa]|uniref:uncharacterized protein LOC110724253 n=1 Tax=Chenopodium quinoa TaxID=63459 RepID=UPI000B798EB0|nr:uncharacterized protein LOC110724253 [Chenopodium quinoa]
MLKDIQVTFGKKNRSKLPKQGYKKCSWRLPYWKFLFVRHCLDVMHIEKNVCDSLINTLLNVNGKTKDGAKARDDLKEMGIRSELHAVDGSKRYLPPASFSLSRTEKKVFCESLAGVKVPEGFSSNISNFVSMGNLKLVGLESHDCHILMQHLLPVTIRSILPKNVRYAIIRLCSFFNAMYDKVIDPKDLNHWETEIAVIICQLEMFFPPSFFDIMIHLPIHLVREIRYCGPVHSRSQWPFERKMKTYKGYVKNAFHPEGCIAERLFYEDAAGLGSEYVENAKVIGIPVSRHTGRMEGKGIIGHKQRDLSYEEWQRAHTYILFNEDEVAPYAKNHIAFLKQRNRKMNHKSLFVDTHLCLPKTKPSDEYLSRRIIIK